MSETPESIKKTTADAMDKAVTYLKSELRGLRTGRATTALVEYVKVEVYGAMTEIKNVAGLSVPEPHQILIKPFDPTTAGAIKKGIEEAGMGVNPQLEDKMVRISIPPLDSNRRKQLVAQAKKMGEEQKVAVRNARRDANKHADALAKDTAAHLSEDQIADLKDEIQELLKKHESEIDTAVKAKSDEILEV